MLAKKLIRMLCYTSMIYINMFNFIIKWGGGQMARPNWLNFPGCFYSFYIASSLYCVFTNNSVHVNERMGTVSSLCNSLFAPVYGLGQTLLFCLLHRIYVSMGLSDDHVYIHPDSNHVMYNFNNCQLLSNPGTHYNTFKLNDQLQVM